MSMGSSGTCTIRIERYVVFTTIQSRWHSNTRWCLIQNCNLGLWQSQRRAVWKAFRGIFTQGTNLQSQYKTFSNLSFLHFFRTLSLVRFGDILTEMIAKVFSGHWQWWYSEVQSSTTPSTPPIMCTHMHHIGRPASQGGDNIRLIMVPELRREYWAYHLMVYTALINDNHHSDGCLLLAKTSPGNGSRKPCQRSSNRRLSTLRWSQLLPLHEQDKT